MNNLKLLPQQFSSILATKISNGEFDSAKQIINSENINVNSYINAEYYNTLIIEVLTSYGCKDEIERTEMIHYLLENGANPNMYCKSGYNALHIAVQRHNLIKSLDLLLDYGGDVNLTDSKGATVAYWAIQGFPWRTEGDERQIHLSVIEKIIMLGADLDLKNKFDITPRKWLEHTSEDVKKLVEECEKKERLYKPSDTIYPKFPTNYKFPEVVEQLRSLIPSSGKANTIESEMLRGLDNLQDEAFRNGNINYNEQHKDFAKFIQTTLTESSIFDEKEIKKINSVAKKLMSSKKPYLHNDVYDYLTDQICIYHNHKNKKEVSKKKWWQFGK
ncbi:ankyrin repeat domain-containing protein [Flavobacterium sp. S87F.05.LMB.W.Kidney.N]|uniref:ankyrin repeat domain-containing protein n=1 Tax=Flavobacterium sp. S87F.05.LMB.W.Kidney.N TaxID=1278758 RepID=UPI00106511C9|nr:ankyrin repeat domain-containing protein [Flavobacterium sp. S87F.05.LMB.W.Kidney.N]TDX12510.1 ankyrin repeat protein [Flavobacterium sp. S87F.05.LMB.W.Kidney.N]